MKKLLTLFLIFNFLVLNFPAFALSEEESEHLRDMRVQPLEPSNAPMWTDYVPKKYENPRVDFGKGAAITELTIGIILTDLILTAPIGIPMICHSTTKLKNISYANKKEKYFDGLKKAQNISADEQEEYYRNLLKECKLKKKHID